ncbi:MAG: hypothetical protein Harvfovirus2_79 [Harvfovirus sp.]|uniref:Uncharacterized protein n=1 Tax=Harvfovirus sp. TaxID=2487768 RepID=A0A3G5A4Z1_9VIRU|nr:MAG: hypothetical protein Harvfovirus2_79 [Harvfovirus sp.]
MTDIESLRKQRDERKATAARNLRFPELVVAFEKMNRAKTASELTGVLVAHKKKRGRYRKNEANEAEAINAMQRAREELEALVAESKAAAAKYDERLLEVTKMMDGLGFDEAMKKEILTAQDLIRKELIELNKKIGDTPVEEEKMVELAHVKKLIEEFDGDLEKKHSDALKLEFPPRQISLLKADILAEKEWMTDPRRDQKTSHFIQILETTQQKIKDGLLSIRHNYARATSYFMYSQEQNCAVMLEQVSSQPVKWGYKYYYEETSIEDVRYIFNVCNGDPIPSLAGGSVDKHAFGVIAT